ncbi:hypothetical protein ACORCE_000518 [Proteus mirabilis]|nr:hypothetical protein [Proteus mirabilis]MDF7208047.1 hypothetical protein [Proteus mirabilis]
MGNTNSVNSVPTNMPDTIISPITIAAVVINTGRKQIFAASIIASRRFRFYGLVIKLTDSAIEYLKSLKD